MIILLFGAVQGMKRTALIMMGDVLGMGDSGISDNMNSERQSWQDKLMPKINLFIIFTGGV